MAGMEIIASFVPSMLSFTFHVSSFKLLVSA